MILERDCMEVMREMSDQEINFVLTDIPYETVSRKDNGLRSLDKGAADIGTFFLTDFLEQVYRIAKNSCCIFCGKEQFSEIYKFFTGKRGTVRPIIWQKTNPSPMNGQHIYLSGVELAVWFKRSGAKTFNAHCKNTVFAYPSGRRTFHPTQKNLQLFEELIRDNTNTGDVIFDPCLGSGTTAIAAMNLSRRWLGCEISPEYYTGAKERIELYDRSKEEISVTEDFFGKNYKITKNPDENNGDTIIEFPNGKTYSVEVKEQELWRFSKWHEYGIDMISMFKFKPGCFWDTKVHTPEELDSFFSQIDILKWGTIVYSTADIWIFYTKNPDGSYYNLKAYDFRRMRQEIDICRTLAQGCRFCRNSKKKDDVAGDWFHSACFFVNPDIFSRWEIKEDDSFGWKNNNIRI